MCVSMPETARNIVQRLSSTVRWVLLTGILLGPPSASGQHSGAFLVLPPTPVESALAGSSSLFSSGAGLTASEEARLAYADRNLGTYSSWSFLPSGIGYGLIAQVIPVSNVKRLGISLLMLNSGSLEQTRWENGMVVSDGSLFAVREFVLKVAAARSLLEDDILSIGSGLKVIHSRISMDSATTVLLDSSVVVKLPGWQGEAGFALKDIGWPLVYDKTSQSVPIRMEWALRYHVPVRRVNALVLSPLFTLPFGGRPTFSLAGEYGIQDLFFIRAGYRFLSDTGRFSLGLGLKADPATVAGLGFMSGRIVRIDLAYIPYPEWSTGLDPYHSIRIGLGIDF